MPSAVAQVDAPDRPLVVPVPQDVIDDYAAVAKGGGVQPDHPAAKALENVIDKFITKNKLAPGTRFVVPHGNLGPVPYEVLPDADGQRNWRPLPGGGGPDIPMS